MFQKGDLVTYGCKGVCEIRDITTLKMDGIPKDKPYYELQPVFDTGARIFTPVEQNDGKNAMRPMLTKQEAEALLDGIGLREKAWTGDDRERETQYREAISRCDASGQLLMIKSLYLRRRDRAVQGRKLSAMDSKYLKIVQENLFRELSLALEMPLEQVEAYVADRIRSRE